MTTATAARCPHCYNPLGEHPATQPDGLIVCAGCAVAEPERAVSHPHPDSPHFWFRYQWEANTARRCDIAGCHARPEDIVKTVRGYDSGYVAFLPGERRF